MAKTVDLKYSRPGLTVLHVMVSDLQLVERVVGWVGEVMSEQLWYVKRSQLNAKMNLDDGLLMMNLLV
jgi:hypothetical protein